MTTLRNSHQNKITTYADYNTAVTTKLRSKSSFVYQNTTIQSQEEGHESIVKRHLYTVTLQDAKPQLSALLSLEEKEMKSRSDWSVQIPTSYQCKQSPHKN